MAKNEEGEFELILGNRQLISVFLVMVILLGVFFSMGYIVGRNSAPASASDTARNSKSAEPADATPASSEPASSPSPQPVSPEPVTATKAKAEPAPVIPAPVAVKEPKVKAAPPSTTTPTAPTTRASVAGDPGPGDYWQVVAAARPDAEIVTEALVKRGFHAVITPAPREGVFRVLVGPLQGASSQAQTRAALEAAGFKNPLLRKY